jgi:hypothetical protein
VGAGVKAKVYNFRKNGDLWVFRFHSKDYFWEALNALKATVPPSDRSYNEDTQEWSVRRGPYDEVLGEVFANWLSEVATIKYQIEMLI